MEYLLYLEKLEILTVYIIKTVENTVLIIRFWFLLLVVLTRFSISFFFS